MKIISDFTEYYDKDVIEAFKNSDYTLFREEKQNVEKIDQIRILKKLGYKTIELKPLKSLFGLGDVVIYSNPKLHFGKGKSIEKYSSAVEMYGNCLACKCYDSRYTYKILKIGSKCYSLIIENIGLKEYKLLSINELNGMIALDNIICSIDFVKDNKDNMIACDLDYCVKLSHIQGLDRVLTSQIIIDNLGGLV